MLNEKNSGREETTNDLRTWSFSEVTFPYLEHSCSLAGVSEPENLGKELSEIINWVFPSSKI